MIIVLGQLLYGVFVLLVITLIARFITKNRWILGALVIVAVLIPTYDIIITNVLGSYYCSQEPNPKTLIKEKVQYPLSIYWEDNVYPGFSKEDRELMIKNYLDGVHLKMMALNGDDGKIYVYSKEIPQESYEELSSHLIQEQKRFDQRDKELKQHDLNKEPQQEWVKIRDEKLEAMKKVDSVRSQIRQLIDNYPVNEQTYTKETMPKMNYTVISDEVNLNPFSRKFLYSDETKVINNQTGETIAYNRRLMRFFYNVFPPTGGNMFYEQHPIFGDWYEIHLKTFNMLEWRLHGFGEHKINLDKHLYNKYIKGKN